MKFKKIIPIEFREEIIGEEILDIVYSDLFLVPYDEKRENLIYESENKNSFTEYLECLKNPVVIKIVFRYGELPQYSGCYPRIAMNLIDIKVIIAEKL